MKETIYIRTEVVNKEKNKLAKIVLDIVIILCLSILVVEFWLMMRIEWMILIPLMYTLFMRKRCGANTSIHEVECRLIQNIKTLEIVCYGVVKQENKYYNRRIVICKEKSCFYLWNEEDSFFEIRGWGKDILEDSQGKLLKQKMLNNM